jgi:transposase
MSDTELLPKPKVGIEAEPVRRIEVFTGTGRRRRWTPEQKALIVAETYESGETVSAVARRHGLTTQQLFTWRRNGQRAQTGASRMAFAPMVLEPSRSDRDDLRVSLQTRPSTDILHTVFVLRRSPIVGIRCLDGHCRSRRFAAAES